MRISDWSSDVCSSDLDIAAVGVDRGDDGDAGGEAAKRLSKLFRVEIARHRKRLRHASETVVHCMHRRGPGPRRCMQCTTVRSEEHTSELQSLMRISYAVFCLKKKTKKQHKETIP